MTKPQLVLSEERDIPLLRFLWKWKVATTSALSEKFFAGKSPITSHKRLWSLERSGFIRSQTISDDGKSFVWSLDRKGFQAIRDSLPVLGSEGFKSEYPSHDLLTSAFHLGDFFYETSTNVVLFSEQQLRRFSFEFYPKAIPKSVLHRPDGYSIIGGGQHQKLVAIEVELTPKAAAEYEQVAEFYRSEKIDDVLWLVPRTTMANRIQRILDRRVVPGESVHSFVTYENFKNLGWQAVFMSGKLAGQMVRTVYGNKPETEPKNVSARLLLDTRKAPHRSKVYRSFTVAEILD